MINLDEPAVMGILNLTPDSFFDGGRYQNLEKMMTHAQAMIDDGADIIDLGAFSSRPNAEMISEEEEANRLLPALKSVRSNFPSIPISVDTFRSSIAVLAINQGANIINDISGGTMDDKMFDVIASSDIPYVLMHMKGTPQNMQNSPTYKDVTKEVKSFFEKQLETLTAKGAKDIFLDPGFGFGKTVEHNYQLLNNLEELNSLGCPILAGVSRKSMINKVLNTAPKEALNGTTVLNTIALLKGAKILRVHDVKEAKECVNLVAKLNA